MQIQLSLIYLWTVQGKLAGDTWLDGTALWYVWRHDDWLGFFPAPDWMMYNALLVNVATWSALAVELAMAVLIWNRRLRPWVLAAGVLLHLSIFFNMAVGLFSPSMFVLYIAFLSPETVKKLPETARLSATKVLARVRRRRPTPDESVPRAAVKPDDVITAPAVNGAESEHAEKPVVPSNMQDIPQTNGHVSASP
jgi:hypothetical protein